MGKTGTVKHTHQYFRRPDGLWACSGIEGCTHYMPKNMSPAPNGRMSLCWVCVRPFHLNPMNMRNEKPLCDECEERGDIIDRMLEERLSGVPVDPYKNFRTSESYLNRIRAKGQSQAPAHESDQADQVEVYETCAHVYPIGVDTCSLCGYTLTDTE